MPTFRRLLPAAALGLAFVLSGCGGHPTARRAMSVVPAAPGAGASYAPATITVNKDDNVILAVGNPTTAIHGFTIEGYGISTQVPPGGTDVKIAARHPGTFKIFCQLHQTHQIATFVVQ